MVPLDKLMQIRERFEYLEARLNAGPDSAEIGNLTREYSELGPVVERIDGYRRLLAEMEAAEGLLGDPEMKALAQAELDELKDRLPAVEDEMRLALLPRDAADARPAIVEIRAGAGGDEAALFAGDLYRMYVRYAERAGWKVRAISGSATEIGGYREIIFGIAGTGVFARLKFESGVHRVQRVPVTESGGRIHTSTATVAVLPEVEEVDIEIDAADIRIDTMRASGAGGQHVNTTDSAVRITHVPTGIVVTSSEKSQHQNRAIAMGVLRARLYEAERERAAAERSATRRGQVGTGDRSERIRTYNVPQGRVTDHRIGLTLYRLDTFLDGDIDEVIDALAEDDQAARLAELDA